MIFGFKLETGIYKATGQKLITFLITAICLIVAAYILYLIPTTESEGNNSGSDDMDSAEIEKKIVSIFEDGIDKGTDIEEIAKLIAPVGGYEIAPVIGSIPYVSYIFETDDAKALAAQLKKSANPRWNICTEANEPVIKVKDNYVFLTMCPGADW